MIELQRPFYLQGQDVFVSASIGIALSTTGYSMPDDLLRDADLAMYRAKANGKSRYEVFDQEMHAHAVALLQLETDLRLAIEREEFRILYQPVLSMRSNRIAGVEALVRWEHPQRGLVLPRRLPRMSRRRRDSSCPMGNVVLREACMRMAEWRREHPAAGEMTISVNLSARQFSHPDLVARVIESLQASGLPPAVPPSRVHRERADRARRPGDRNVRQAACTRHPSGSGRLRHRLLVARLSPPLRPRRAQDRPLVRVQHRARTASVRRSCARSSPWRTTSAWRSSPREWRRRAQAAVLQGVGCDLVQGYLFGGALSAEEMAERFSADVLV